MIVPRRLRDAKRDAAIDLQGTPREVTRPSMRRPALSRLPDGTAVAVPAGLARVHFFCVSRRVGLELAPKDRTPAGDPNRVPRLSRTPEGR